MDHPTFDRLSDHVYDLDENPAEIDVHLRACASCAQVAWRLQRERMLLTSSIPAARRRLPWAMAAAALLVAVSAAITVRATFRARDLEGRLQAALKPAPPGERPFSEVLDELCRIEIDRSLTEMVAQTELSPDARDAVRDALRATASAPREVFQLFQHDEMDEDALASTDLLPSLERDLRAKLSGDEFARVSDALDKQRAAAAKSLAARAVSDLVREVRLTPSQRQAIERLLTERTSWRNDIAFVPELIRDLVLLSAMASGSGHQEISALLDDSQRTSFHEYLQHRRGELRRKNT